MTDLAFVPSTRNIDLYAGDGATIVLNVTTPDGIPVRITGPVQAHIRRHRTDPQPLDEFKVILDDRLEGRVELQLNGQQTQGLLNGDQRFTGYYDVQLNRALPRAPHPRTGRHHVCARRDPPLTRRP